MAIDNAAMSWLVPLGVAIVMICREAFLLQRQRKEQMETEAKRELKERLFACIKRVDKMDLELRGEYVRRSDFHETIERIDRDLKDLLRTNREQTEKHINTLLSAYLDKLDARLVAFELRMTQTKIKEDKSNN